MSTTKTVTYGTFPGLDDLIKECKKRPDKLSKFEDSFMKSITDVRELRAAPVFSSKQLKVLKDIENKMFGD